MINEIINRPGVAGAVLQTQLGFIHSFIKGNRAFADLKYGEEDSISPSTQIFPAKKKLTRDIYFPYPPWGTLEVSPVLKLNSVCYGMFCPLGLKE